MERKKKKLIYNVVVSLLLIAGSGVGNLRIIIWHPNNQFIEFAM